MGKKKKWEAPVHWGVPIQLDTDMWVYRTRGGIQIYREAEDGSFEPRVVLLSQATLRAYVAGLPKKGSK